MSRPSCLYDLWKAIVARALRGLRQRHGEAFVGVVIEAGLSATVEHLRTHQGPEAAFNTLTRHADASIAPVLDPRLTPENQD
ncbi:hypothetical protein MFUR16E_04535 [Methylobacterium fujisawaense]|uniref:hypothetical protein n=1 Tax=Methylobacterium fujisawaense TaxID=107400 RepID=UPI002F323FFB